MRSQHAHCCQLGLGKLDFGCPWLLLDVLLHKLEEELPLLLVLCDSEVEYLIRVTPLSAMLLATRSPLIR